jgi:hypothetical protein
VIAHDSRILEQDFGCLGQGSGTSDMDLGCAWFIALKVSDRLRQIAAVSFLGATSCQPSLPNFDSKFVNLPTSSIRRLKAALVLCACLAVGFLAISAVIKVWNGEPNPLQRLIGRGGHKRNDFFKSSLGSMGMARDTRNLNLNTWYLGEEMALPSSPHLLETPTACCDACVLEADCTVWSWCSATAGCERPAVQGVIPPLAVYSQCIFMSMTSQEILYMPTTAGLSITWTSGIILSQGEGRCHTH